MHRPLHVVTAKEASHCYAQSVGEEKGTEKKRGQALFHKIRDVTSPGVLVLFQTLVLSLGMAVFTPHQDIEKVGAGDHPQEDVVFDDRQDALFSFDDLGFNLWQVGLGGGEVSASTTVIHYLNGDLRTVFSGTMYFEDYNAKF